MSERLVTTVRTKPSLTGFGEALRQVWPEATQEGAGVLWSHFAIETGEGLYCFNHNLGNVKHVKGDGHDYISLKGVWEGFRVKDEDGDGDIDEEDRRLLIERLTKTGLWRLDPSQAHQVAVGKGKVSMIAEPQNHATWFRAYPSLSEGMRAFVNKKKMPGYRYSSAWPFVIAGDPDGYARELGRKGYYTASPDVYARSLTKKFDAWMKGVSWSAVATPKETHATPTPVRDFDIVHPDVPLKRGS